MSVPTQRRTSSKVGQRRSHHALEKVVLNKCEECGKAVRPHSACPTCGNYKGRKAVKIKAKKAKSK